MEAASARRAMVDRWSVMDGAGPVNSTLQRYILQACSPENFEPNLALNLEIADLINAKQGNAPREAAVAIVGYINHRNPNVAILALNLLDICVKNCGYPFHLQISTKDFLNELVRRFPERPPIRPSRVQMKILEAIEEWRGTICQTSRYKEDLGFIRDMHRLLSFKGYMFPEVRREDAAVLNPSDNLKSAEEMEQEERAAQSAKLQELIRRGGPEELQEANRLMKIMAGYDTRQKTDYRAKAAEEVGKIQQKARLLEERLAEFKPGDKMTEGDVFEELASALQSAHPKIQKMCEEESDDHEAVAKLLEINDSIHRTVERYKLMKKGDVEAASKIAKGTLGTSTGVSKNGDNELSLIDFGGEGETSGSSSAPAQPGGLEDDLLGLSMNDGNFNGGGGISLGFGANTSTVSTFKTTYNANYGQDLPGPALLSSTIERNNAKVSAPSPSFSSPQGPSKPNYSAFSAYGGPQFISQSSSPAPSIFQQQQQQHQSASRQGSQPASDPFAALTSPIRHSTPQQSAAPTSAPASLFDFSNAQPAAAASANDDEWSFASALPEENGLPISNDMVITDNILRVILHATRQSGADSVIIMTAKFSNKQAQPVSELTFQVAVTKGFHLQLEPQTGRSMQPFANEGIRQVIRLHGVQKGQAAVRMRWKLSYRLGTELQNENGEISGLGIE